MSAKAKRQVRGKTHQQRAAQKELRRRARRSALLRPGAAGAAAAVALSMTGVGAAEAADQPGGVEPRNRVVRHPGATGCAPEGASARGAPDRRRGVTRSTVRAVSSTCGVPTALPRTGSALGGVLFFAGGDGANGTELWKSDGTAGGTVLVKDIRPGSNGSSPRNLTVVGGTAVLHRRRRHERHASCGSPTAPPPGTVLVKAIDPGRRLLRRAQEPHRGRRHPLLHRQRRHERPRAVEVRRHRCRAPCWSRSSTPAPPAVTTPPVPRNLTAWNRCSLLHRQRRRQRPRAVEVRRHRGRDRAGQGHPVRRRTAAAPTI